LLLYTVEDMSDWKYQGIWLTTENPVAAAQTPAEIWECPQLVRVPSDEAASDGDDTWVMMFSLWLSGDDHEHANGVGHLIGSLAEDPSTGLPVFVPRSGGRSDLGRDFYAPQIVQLDTASSSGSESEPRALLWGWANEGPGRDGRRGRSQDEIDAAGWAGVLTHPRFLSVEDGALVVAPAPEVDAYRGPVLAAGASGAVDLPPFAEAVVTAGTVAGAGEVRLVLASGAERQVVFAGPLSEGEELRIFVDASLVEVYRTGSVATTLRAYPAAGEAWILELPEGAAAEVWELKLPE
jgi:beta-fructofuranosidase